MTIDKELPSIAWQASEPEYRADPALSYSTLARFEREGFNKLGALYEHISTPSLIFGSMVDTLITGSEDEFNSIFFVTDFPPMGDKELQIADSLYERYGNSCSSMTQIPSEGILDTANVLTFQKNWKDDTRIRVIRERCTTYYDMKVSAGGRTVVSLDTFQKVKATVNALKESPATHGYFTDNDPLSPIRRYYQLKFKACLQGVDYRCMADLIIVDYEDKKIVPIDLKTSSHKEWDFQDSFCQWSYMIQARLYWLIIKTNLANDPYFKDFQLEDYRFIVVNKESLTPLVWQFPLTGASGTLVDNKGNKYRDPLEIGAELRSYLDNMPPVPKGIDIDGLNIITCLHKFNA